MTLNSAKKLIAAAVQMQAGVDKAANLATATRLVEEAAAAGAELVVLPEFFSCLGPWEDVLAAAEPVPGPTSEAMAALAARLGITLVAGSICEQSPTPGKGFNTSLMFDPTGKQIALYRKMHLFDVDVPEMVSVQESQWIVPGEEIVATQTPLGVIGQATCYDLRFPELFRALADRRTEIVAFPSAFTAPTGKAHWHVLLRARAIENQAFIVAANQIGQHTPNLATYGHSLIVDPWGEVLADVGEAEEGVAVATLDRERLEQIRRQLPALANRRM